MVVTHGEVLSEVADGLVGVRQVATELVVSASTVRRRLADMVERGWLRREGSWYVLTERGRQVLHDNEEW